MTQTATKAKKATPPATTPDTRLVKPHEVVLSPTIQSALAIEAWSKFAGTVDLADLVDDLHERIKKVQGGDMRPVEAMLLGQAMTLETIFTSLARRATSQEYLKQFQTYLSLALKAQAQCRATLEALAEVKNPRPVLITKQANVANGPQQVNNVVSQASGQAAMETPTGAHAEKSEAVQNGLLEASHEPPAESGNAVQGDVGKRGDRRRAACGQTEGPPRGAQQSSGRS